MLAKMTMRDYFDWLERCSKMHPLFKFCFPMCLELRTVHMATKETCTKAYKNTFYEFPDGYFQNDYASLRGAIVWITQNFDPA